MRSPVVLACLLTAAAGMVRAESFVASSASLTSSASITASSASDSIKGSSNSSRQGNTARAGDYRIEQITRDEAAGKVRLTLAPLQGDAERDGFVLALPQRAFEPQALARGDALAVRERPYGLEIARGDTKQAFFLVLADEWHRELDAKPVVAAARPAP